MKFELDDYEAANLREALRACRQRSPLQVLDTGDWLGQILNRLNDMTIDGLPNVDADEMRERALEWNTRRESKWEE